MTLLNLILRGSSPITVVRPEEAGSASGVQWLSTKFRNRWLAFSKEFRLKITDSSDFAIKHQRPEDEPPSFVIRKYLLEQVVVFLIIVAMQNLFWSRPVSRVGRRSRPTEDRRFVLNRNRNWCCCCVRRCTKVRTL